MSLVWPANEASLGLGEPRLHAFIIAVGDYPHLLGGTGALASDPFGLKQVTTPRFTGPKIAEWLMGKFVNSGRPLGSIEMLSSPGGTIDTPTGPASTEPATMKNIETSFKAWLERCNSHPQNAAFFYFCGHGIWKNAQYLLPEDFGNPAVADAWDNCVDFDGFRNGMRKCSARTQLFFVDACRDTPFGVLAQMNPRGKPLISATYTDPPVPCSATYYAATDGLEAHGPNDGPTYFSQALLCCFNGVGAISKSGKWIVDTYSLASGLGQAMTQYARQTKLPLACHPAPQGMALIHEVSTPRVIVAVECTSSAASDVADIKIANGATVLHSAPGQPKPIVADVDAGDWTVTVSFPGGQFSTPAPERYKFMPPVFEGVAVP